MLSLVLYNTSNGRCDEDSCKVGWCVEEAVETSVEEAVARFLLEAEKDKESESGKRGGEESVDAEQVSPQEETGAAHQSAAARGACARGARGGTACNRIRLPVVSSVMVLKRALHRIRHTTTLQPPLLQPALAPGAHDKDAAGAEGRRTQELLSELLNVLVHKRQKMASASNEGN